MFCFSLYIFGSLVGIVIDSVLHFSFFFLRFICKHFVKMYILGKLFLYAIGMLYNALMFKLSVLYFFNCLVVIAQQKLCIGDNKFRLNSAFCVLTVTCTIQE